MLQSCLGTRSVFMPRQVRNKNTRRFDNVVLSQVTLSWWGSHQLDCILKIKIQYVSIINMFVLLSKRNCVTSFRYWRNCITIFFTLIQTPWPRTSIYIRPNIFINTWILKLVHSLWPEPPVDNYNEVSEYCANYVDFGYLNTYYLHVN